MRSTRGRVLIAVLVVAAVVALTVIVVTRGSAVTAQYAPYGTTFSVGQGAYTTRVVPAYTPITIAISETGSGSSATATIVACTDGAGWSWIGLNGNGSSAQGHSATVAGTIMCQTLAGQYVRFTGPSTLYFQSTANTARVYMHY